MSGTSVSRKHHRSCSILIDLRPLSSPCSDFGRYECPRPEKLRCQYGIYTEREQDGCDTYHCKRVYGQECVHSEQCAAGLDCRCDNKCKEIGTICSEIVKQRLEEHKRFPSRFPSWFPRIRWQKLSQKYVEPEYKD